MSAYERDLERLVGAVLVPEVRPAGFRPDDETLERYPPVGAIVFRGLVPGAGPAEELWPAVRARCEELSGLRPFGCADLEEGAGLHFRGGTRLPPAMALAAAEAGALRRGEDGAELLAEAGRITAAEARALGIELVLAPVVDVNSRAGNPIIAVRSYGDRAFDVTRRARAFLDGLHAGGAGGCLKHYPGHGDTREDSHLELARVDKTLEELWAEDLAPYRGLRDADAVMVGHLRVAGAQEDAEADLPATLSRALATGLLRDSLGYRGTLLTDALDMGGVARVPRRFARAIEAGCEGLLCMAAHREAAEELRAAVRTGELSEHRLEHAAASMRALADRLAQRTAAAVPADPASSARRLARAALVQASPRWPFARGSRVEVRGLGADDPTPEALRDALGADAAPHDEAPVVVVAAGVVRAWRGRAGLDPGALERLLSTVGELRERRHPRAVVWFASPQLVPQELREDAGLGLLIAFTPSPPMVAAAADFLRGTCAAQGASPSRAAGPRD